MSELIADLLKTAVFFFSLHVLLPPFVHVLTLNRWIKLPAFVLLGLVAGTVMAYFQYVPLLLLLIWLPATHFNLKIMSEGEFEAENASNGNPPLNLALYRLSLYSYVVVACLVAVALQVTIVGPSGETAIWDLVFGGGEP